MNLPSLTIPTARHFWKRQYWQRFLLRLSTGQLLAAKHTYLAFFCTVRLRRTELCYNHVIVGARFHALKFISGSYYTSRIYTRFWMVRMVFTEKIELLFRIMSFLYQFLKEFHFMVIITFGNNMF